MIRFCLLNIDRATYADDNTSHTINKSFTEEVTSPLGWGDYHTWLIGLLVIQIQVSNVKSL